MRRVTRGGLEARAGAWFDGGMASTTVTFGAGALVGALCGLAGGLVLRAPGATTVAVGADVARHERGAAAPDAATPGPGAAPAPMQRLPAGPVAADLDTFAAEEARRAWRAVRSDDLPDETLQRIVRDYELQVRELPAAWAARAAAEASEREQRAAALAGNDAVAALRALDGRDDDARAFAGSPRFAGLFAPRGGGVNVDGVLHRQGQPVPTGAVLAYPAGVYEVGSLVPHSEPFPADVTLRGAGMDATLLVLEEQTVTRWPLERLRIEHCTVFCDSIVDVRNQPASIVLSGVRVVGFDCGAGSAAAFGLYGGIGALLVQNSRFEGGYGRAPQSYANLMDARGTCLARFEACVFDRVSLDNAGPAVHFVGCVMQELLGAAPTGPVYENCRITVIDPQKQWDGEYRRRNLDDLFPQWRERLRR